MAEVEAAEKDLLQQKWGPLPVWVWALAGLAAAWLFAKYRANKTASSSSATATNAQQDQAVAPQWIINEGGPTTTVNVPSAPVATSPGQPPPVTTPPGTGNHPPIKGGNPPKGPKPPVPVKAQPQVYRVQPGDTLTSIANRFQVPGGAQALFQYQLASPLRTAQAKAEIRTRGIDHLVQNEEILIPPK